MLRVKIMLLLLINFPFQEHYSRVFENLWKKVSRIFGCVCVIEIENVDEQDLCKRIKKADRKVFRQYIKLIVGYINENYSNWQQTL
jgi:hypothetical protein